MKDEDYSSALLRTSSRFWNWHHKKRLTDAIQFASLKPSDLVLDMGCADGPLERILLPHYGRIVAADVNPYLLKKVREEHRKLSLVECDIRALPFPEGLFDVVFCLEVLEYIPFSEMQDSILGLVCLLRNGGTLVISVTIKTRIANLVRTVLKALYFSKHGSVNSRKFPICKIDFPYRQFKDLIESICPLAEFHGSPFPRLGSFNNNMLIRIRKTNSLCGANFSQSANDQ